jgi:cobalt-zinc-cadmium efflux system outer membrane protein
MTRKFLFLALCMTTLLLLRNAVAQSHPQEIMIEAAVQEALQRNLDLLAKRFDVDIARAQIISASLRPNPVLSFGGDHLDLLGTGFNRGNAGGPEEYSARTDFLIETFGKRRKRMDVAQLDSSIAELGFLDATRALALDVRNAATDVLTAQLNLALMEENVRALRRIADLNQTRVRAGDLAPVEAARSSLAALQAENELRRARAAARDMTYRLAVLLGRNPSEPIRVAGDLNAEAVPVAYDDLLAKATQNRPDYLAQLRARERASADLKLQVAQGKVDFTAGTEYRRQQGVNGKSNSLGLFVSVPLPFFNRNQGEITRARLQQQQSDKQVAATTAQLSKN